MSSISHLPSIFHRSDLFSDLFGSYRAPNANAKKRTTTSSSSSTSKTKKSSSSTSSSSNQAENDGSFFTAKSKKARAKKNKPAKGADVTLDVNLSFLEAAQGVSKLVEFTADGVCQPCRGTGQSSLSSSNVPTCRSCNGRGVQNMKMPGHINVHVTCERCDGSGVYEPPCSHCTGTGTVREKRSVRVNIPAGVENATSIRVVNQGHAGKRGGAQGHLLLKALVAQHPLFTRDGYDLHIECSLPLTTALLGGTAHVPTLDGGVTQVRVEQGTQNAHVQVLAGKGIKALQNTGASPPRAGAQVVTWKVDIPRTLTPKSKDLLKQLALEMGNIHNIDLTADITAMKGKGKAAPIEEEKSQPTQTPPSAPKPKAASATSKSSPTMPTSSTTTNTATSTNTANTASSSFTPADSEWAAAAAAVSAAYKAAKEAEAKPSASATDPRPATAPSSSSSASAKPTPSTATMNPGLTSRLLRSRLKKISDMTPGLLEQHRARAATEAKEQAQNSDSSTSTKSTTRKRKAGKSSMKTATA